MGTFTIIATVACYNASQVSNISMAVRLELAYIVGALLITNIMLLPFSTLLSVLRLQN